MRRTKLITSAKSITDDEMTQIFTARETVTIYKDMDNTRNPYLVRMKAGDTGIILADHGLWLQVQAKSVVGFVERKRGTINSTTPPPPVPTADLLYIKGYFEVYGMSNPEYRGQLLRKEEVYAGIYGLPAAIKMYNTRQIDIREGTATRKLWLELFTAAAPVGMDKATINKRFIGLLKNGVCYTDFAGNVGFNQIITANNMAYSMGNPERKAGTLYHPIRCLKVGTYNSMREQIEKYPYLVSKATISNRFDDGRGVDPFWHLDGNTVPVPQFCADAVNWIEEKWVLPIGEYVSGYYPPREAVRAQNLHPVRVS